jgi:hypothetical protein
VKNEVKVGLWAFLVSTAAVFGKNGDWWDRLAIWEDPSRQSAGMTATLGDSDEDAQYVGHWTWWSGLETSAWEWGWEVGLGLANSGKYERTGAVGVLDLVVRRPLFDVRGTDVGLLGAAGLQVQSIEFPGGSYYNGRLALAFDFLLPTNREKAWNVRLGYLHISNANLGPGNEGVDSIWLGAGWAW